MQPQQGPLPERAGSSGANRGRCGSGDWRKHARASDPGLGGKRPTLRRKMDSSAASKVIRSASVALAAHLPLVRRMHFSPRLDCPGRQESFARIPRKPTGLRLKREAGGHARTCLDATSRSMDPMFPSPPNAGQGRGMRLPRRSHASGRSTPDRPPSPGRGRAHASLRAARGAGRGSRASGARRRWPPGPTEAA